MCGIAIELDGRAASSRSAATRTTRSAAATSARRRWRSQDVHEDPDRLRRPLRRTASGWEEVSWDEALDEAADAARRGAARPRPQRGGLLPGQPRRPQPRRDPVRPALPAQPGQAQPLLGHLGRPAAADARLAADVRAPAAAAGARHRPHRVPARARRQPARLERQPDDRARHRAAAQGAAGARRAARGGRPAPHRDRGARRPAPRHPARHRRAPARGARSTRSSPRSALAPGRLAAFTDGLERWSRAVAALRARGGGRPRPASTPTTIRALARDFAARPSAVAYGRVGVSTQEFGGLAAWLVNVLNVVTGNLDRPGGAMFTAPGGRPRGARRPPRPARPLRQGPEPRARPARVRRRVARGGARRGDRDAGRRARSGRSSRMRRQPGALDAQRRAARPRARRARLHGLDRHLPATRPRATRT